MAAEGSGLRPRQRLRYARDKLLRAQAVARHMRSLHCHHLRHPAASSVAFACLWWVQEASGYS